MTDPAITGTAGNSPGNSALPVAHDEVARPDPTGLLERIPLTRFGVGVVVLGALAYMAGWRLGWIELLVLASACLVAVVIAVPFIIGRSRIDLTRQHRPHRVSAGDVVTVTLTATNRGRTPSRRVQADEHIGAHREPIVIPALAPGSSHESEYRLPTTQRAKVSLGPAVITRSDPLGLMRRDISESDASELWVYPRTCHTAPLPVGFAKDLEGPTSDTSPAGDISFHTIRPYQSGDDRRHIHWLTTARTGELMVRHFVDNRRPHVAVLLDRGRGAYADDGAFETAVSVAASIGSSMLRQQLPASIRLGDRTVLGTFTAAGEEAVLEEFTVVDRNEADATDLAVSAAEFVRLESRASALVVVTGSRSAADLLPTVVHARRKVRVVIVHVVPHDHAVDDEHQTRISVPGARSIQVTDLDDFAHAWQVLY